MRGALLSLAAGIFLASIWVSSAGTVPSVLAIIKEKAAAVSIVRQKAKKYAASLAQGRLFNAYLTAATANEGERLKARILTSLKALENHYGLQNFTVIDRSGELFLHAGKEPAPTEKRNMKKDPVLVAGFASDAPPVSTLMQQNSVTYVAPVTRNGQKEFVLSIEQNLTAYEKVLTLGLAKTFYVVIINAKGDIISDSRGAANAGKQALIAGLTIEQLQTELRGNTNEGTGIVSKDGTLFTVAYQTVDDWTVVAIAQSKLAEACLRTGDETCH